jgi:hypothetical protein
MVSKNKFAKKSKINIALYIIIILFIGFALIIRFFIIGVDHTIDNKDLAIQKCKELCIIKSAHEPISIEGPCLSNEIVSGWSCDVVSNPRLSMYDNKKENMCEKNKHIVEITKECKLIRAI